MAFSPSALAQILGDLKPPAPAGGLCVAFSGGVDSVVLLAALAELRAEGRIPPVRAIHVNHQLHADAGLWQARCRDFAAALGVPFDAAVVQVVETGSGVEAAARAARYEVLYGELAPGDILLTAHHADDQLETVLLALMRGSGVRGLAGMPRSITAGRGWHQRPLLGWTRAELEAWARERDLAWSDDPANTHLRYSRSFLRQSVVPLLRERWPAVAEVTSRSAAHLVEASELLDELAAADLVAAAEGESLRLSVLAGLASARRRNLLRYWVRQRGLPLPGTAKLQALEHDVLAARPDARICVTWAGAEVRRYRGLLYAFAPMPVLDAQESQWGWREALTLPGGGGELSTREVYGTGLAVSRLPERLEVSTRTAAVDSQRSLRKILQARHVLPWWRDRLPLICAAGRLLAVGDLWVNPAMLAGRDEPGVYIEWRKHPVVVAP